MRLMGWHDRSMVDRYAADMQDQRAFEAKRRTNRWQSYGTLNDRIRTATRGQAFAEVERKE